MDSNAVPFSVLRGIELSVGYAGVSELSGRRQSVHPLAPAHIPGCTLLSVIYKVTTKRE
jgi:hypothetical protein